MSQQFWESAPTQQRLRIITYDVVQGRFCTVVSVMAYRNNYEARRQWGREKERSKISFYIIFSCFCYEESTATTFVLCIFYFLKNLHPPLTLVHGRFIILWCFYSVCIVGCWTTQMYFANKFFGIHVFSSFLFSS